MNRLATMAAALLLFVMGPAQAGAPSPYQPYEFLIGEWNVGADGAPPAMVARLRWGPNRSYIWYAASLLKKEGEEPHFEGVLMWNGVSKKLDMLIMLDLTDRAGAQESGTVSVDADGTVVRNVTATYAKEPDGATAHFRQTYRRLSPDKVLTAVLRETPGGWVPTFPGSDKFVMSRRPAA